MTAQERIMKICAADPTMLAKVDAVLKGEAEMITKTDPDVRTCTLTEAAHRIGVSRPTVYRLIKKGAIRTIPLCGVSRVVLQSLFDYIAGRT